jgi:non-specific serine/threonine protein kinase
MALSHLLKFVYNSGTDEVIRRGKKIYASGFVEFLEYDELLTAVSFRVKDDNYNTYYKVYIQKFRDSKTLSIRCSCPYNLGDICRHESAALFQLQELVDKNILGEKGLTYQQRHTVIKMKQIDLKTIKLLSAPDTYNDAEQYLRKNKAQILLAKEERVEAVLEIEKEKFPIVIHKNEERNFDTSCKCEEVNYPLCLHKTIVFIQLLHQYGINYFDSIKNWEKEKNKLLEAYGYSTKDEGWQKKFEFAYKEGKPFLRVLDPTIKRIILSGIPLPKPVVEVAETVEVAPVEEISDAPLRKIGIVINANEPAFPHFSIDAISGEFNESSNWFVGKIEKADLSKFVNVDKMPQEDAALVQQLRKFQNTEINKFVSRNSPFSGIWENIIQQDSDELPAETKELVIEYLLPKLKKLLKEQQGFSPFYFLPKGKTFVTNNLVAITAGTDSLRPVFKVYPENNYFVTECNARVNELSIALEDNDWNAHWLMLYNDVLYLWEKEEDVEVINDFLPNGKIITEKELWPDFLQHKINNIAKLYSVDFDNQLIDEIKDGEPEIKLQLQEKGDYLVFSPVFTYKGYDIRANDKEVITIPREGKVMVINRNKDVETDFVEKLEALHSNFIRTEGQTLVLKGIEVLKNNWFFLFVDAMKDMGVPIIGFDVLKNFRFHTAKPTTKIRVSSGIDWFDAKVEIVFGDQMVNIAEIKRAIANKQQFVQLDDGSLGILPEEWLKKYTLLFKVGEGKQNGLRLSKYHLSIIDELYAQRGEEDILIELEEKYERLRSFNRIKELDAPEALSHILRPYQVAGYHWLNYLNEVGWGGILADDMGLGKTIQALSFIQFFKEQKGTLTSMVVCPTTLIFNWENEIRKFTPGLTYKIHHGSDRCREKKDFDGINIIITTYGTLRSDIKLMLEIDFDYVVLDESQAIKNPQSKVTKAASLLNAKNRLCLSGTPLQNNTFDIYAQMNFLNPGMLGSVEFFRNEFATPIDKFGEPEQKDHLRKLLFPFILRRTKEQVAKDLPEKTETILFCEMEDEQRKIYEAFRNEFRNKILGVINDQGIEKSQLTILQGLMKLRQICDSPYIMNDVEKYPNASIKLEELGREISENMGNHKALVFSQFLGMLALIRERLNELGIPYEYFDGSTTAVDREKAIRNFQDNPEVRVFLISLKAGGVGLNLTAADYVYIVDPWWNPAVEQQAIDRTHRIGQTKNIFAYRMICKDTIEDKILQLQEKKKVLARDLIADDSGFVKSLSKADVEYLFS